MEKNKKRLFTQKELEKHINARLIRERKKNSSGILQRLTEELAEMGMIDADSCAVAAQTLGKLLSVGDAENSEGVAGSDGTVLCECGGAVSDASTEQAENLRDIGEFCDAGEGAVCDGISETSVNTENAVSEYTDGMGDASSDNASEYCECEKSDADVTFDSECGGERTEDVSEASKVRTDAERLLYLLGELGRILEPLKSGCNGDDGAFSARREACSTGFSKGSSLAVHSFSEELTPMQREIARRAGISYREYAELLRDIPERTRKRK